ncbi:MAG: glycosyltransferase [Actinomycetota bacterium]|nr:glycosyltransferase [Actinomycetota bacterium]MDP3629932.1 glycosyltransferase [Actinomycetota bacterium]
MSAIVCPPLFVYIPTYNRPESLRRQIVALTAQRADWPGDMRVLVSDNASPSLSDDDLMSISSEFGVDVRRNPANIGANANIALGFVFARTDELLWILSDNDTLGTTALHSIAARGMHEGSDAVIFSTKTDAPSGFVHQWTSAWDGVHEVGLISNVIYRSSVFLPYTSQAFFYHNTSFPHLCVLLSALKDRGSLSYAVLPSVEVFAPQGPHGEQAGDYSLSHNGMPQLLPLLPGSQARKFARLWLREQGGEFFRQRDAYPGIHISSKASLRAYGGFKARVLLCALAIRHAILGPIIPPIKRALRSRRP